MKKSLLFVYFILSCLGFVGYFSSCVTSDSFSVPEAICKEPAISPTIDMGAFQKLALGSSYKLQDDYVIEGYVVSSDLAGNFFKTLSVVSKDGLYGISLNIDRTSLSTRYEPGRKVYIRPKGLYIGKVDDQVELGIPYNGSIGRIPDGIIDSFLFRGCSTVNENTLVQKATLSQLVSSTKYLNTLVEIDSIQFGSKSAGQTYYSLSTASGSGSNQTIEDEAGNSLVVRISEFANFANATIPKGICKIRGVLQKFGTTSQLMIRDTSDVRMYAPAEIWGFSTTAIKGKQISVKALRDSFNLKALSSVTITDSAFIEGIVTVSPNGSNNTGSTLNVFVQDASAGILVRLSQSSRLLEGYKIRIDVRNAILSKFNGLLQLSNIRPLFNIQVLDDKAVLPVPKSITISDFLSGAYESQFVSIPDVQFIEKPSLFSGYNYLTDGTKLALVYTQSAASFANELVPQKRGTFVGVASFFNGYQLIVRSTADLYMNTQDRVDVSTQATRQPISYLRRIGNTLAVGAKTQISENITVKGVITSDASTGNIQVQNIFMQDDSAGVMIRFSADPQLSLGKEVEVNLLGATAENYNGLLQINDVSISAIVSRKDGILPTPKLLKISQLNESSYQGMLVAIDSVQFVDSGNFVRGGNTTLQIATCTNTLDVFIRSDASFGNQAISNGSGRIIGVLSAFNAPQLYIRSAMDVAFAQARISCSAPAVPNIMITEIADPLNEVGARFVELYNAGTIDVNLAGWKLIRYDNGGVVKNNIALASVVLAPKTFYIVANNKKAPSGTYLYDSLFVATADLYHSGITINGNDVVQLENDKGEVVDAFGEKGVDGIGKSWEYTDGRATRNASISKGNAVFTISEWAVITKNQNAPANFAPRVR